MKVALPLNRFIFKREHLWSMIQVKYVYVRIHMYMLVQIFQPSNKNGGGERGTRPGFAESSNEVILYQ